MLEHFVRPHVCLSVSVAVASWVLGGRDVGLSLYLDLGGHGFESES